MPRYGLHRAVAVCVSIAALAAASGAQALPSYARQLNVACSTCHTAFPELNAFGRQFKLNAYALGEGPTKPVESKDSNGRETLSLSGLPPLSVMMQAAYTGLNQAVPDTQNGNAQLPQEASLFLAGHIAPGLGSFVQLTYSQADGEIGLDNAELRYSHQAMLKGKPVTYGAVVNNNPTLEDLWNSTPAWGFPWTGPDVAPTPDAAPLIDDALAQDVMGAGGYALFAGKFYVASTLYRSAHVGNSTPDASSQNTIDNAALYWRFAWQHPMGSRYLEVGTYGMRTHLIPDGVAGSTDDYNDLGVDFQYEQPAGARRFVAHGRLLHERRDLAATFAAGDALRPRSDLDSLRVDAGWYGQRLGYVFGFAGTRGKADDLLYAPDAITGSAGRPDSTAVLGELIYSPWENVQLRAQYTAYGKFNGARHDYDGFGRNASDNNTLFLQAWFAW